MRAKLSASVEQIAGSDDGAVDLRPKAFSTLLTSMLQKLETETKGLRQETERLRQETEGHRQEIAGLRQQLQDQAKQRLQLLAGNAVIDLAKFV